MFFVNDQRLSCKMKTASESQLGVKLNVVCLVGYGLWSTAHGLRPRTRRASELVLEYLTYGARVACKLCSHLLETIY